MLSIIIPVFNQHEMTDECIETVLKNTSDFEIVVIDNGSEPRYQAPAGVSVIRNDDNAGFPIAVNQGIRASSGDVIILLNNDVFVTPGWAGKLSKALETYDIVAPVTNYCAGVQRVEVKEYQNLEELNQSAEIWADKVGDATQEVNFVIGFCMAFKKTLYDEIGPFDESLWPCSGEEISFCLAARAAGYKVGVVSGCYVHHEGSKTFNSMDVDYDALCKRNDVHIAEKWGEGFWERQRVILAPVEGLRLNLGCGGFPIEGFLNVDQFADVNPDLVCDVTGLPYEKGSVSEIYAGHLLEHFRFDDGMKALRYWFSLLKPGGVIGISVPDYDFLVKEYVKNPTPDSLKVFNDVYIYSGIQPSPHLYAYSAALLKQVMEEAGFINIERMPINHPYFPFAVDWQVGFFGRKP